MSYEILLTLKNRRIKNELTYNVCTHFALVNKVNRSSTTESPVIYTETGVQPYRKLGMAAVR